MNPETVAALQKAAQARADMAPTKPPAPPPKMGNSMPEWIGKLHSKYGAKQRANP